MAWVYSEIFVTCADVCHSFLEIFHIIIVMASLSKLMRNCVCIIVLYVSLYLVLFSLHLHVLLLACFEEEKCTN